jgi:phosphopantothenoylcysteine decarboxylase/phosphopantothenate--cysteine ligase
MTHVLITSGPTREYLDPVRYLSNASSGRMGCALAEAALEYGYRVTIVSGPVSIDYPRVAELIRVETTEEMLQACLHVFPHSDGCIAAAAPCDYRPAVKAVEKIAKSGRPLELLLYETPDILATLAEQKRADQWLVGFALETHDAHARAISKLQRKKCDLIIVNGPQAISASTNDVEIFDRQGVLLERVSGSKQSVAHSILHLLDQRFVQQKNFA